MFSSTACGGGLREGTVDVPSSSLLVVVGVAVPSYTGMHCVCVECVYDTNSTIMSSYKGMLLCVVLSTYI